MRVVVPPIKRGLKKQRAVHVNMKIPRTKKHSKDKRSPGLRDLGVLSAFFEFLVHLLIKTFSQHVEIHDFDDERLSTPRSRDVSRCNAGSETTS